MKKFFQVSLWKTLELLEKYFGSVVGSNVIITPKGTKGLPLQNNDMEVRPTHLNPKLLASCCNASKDYMLYHVLEVLPTIDPHHGSMQET